MADNIKSTEIYQAMKITPEVGQIRCKKWRSIIPPSGPDDPLWCQRCLDYWGHQQKVYGLRFSEITMYWDPTEEVVVSETVIVAILPGERVMVH